MILYLFLLFFILFFRYLVLSEKNYKRRQNSETRYSYIVWGIIILLAALRHPTVGTDTYSYISDYKNVRQLSFADIADQYNGYLGYFYTSKLFTLMGMPVQVWFGVLEALYAYSMAKFVNRYSKDKLFSIIVFVTTGLLSFSFAGLKQVMSMSLMMLAFLSFVDKKYIATVCMVVAAYSCHPAGMIFLAAFPFYYLRNKSYDMLLIVLSTVFIMAYNTLFLTGLVGALENDHFEVYLEINNSYTSTTLIFYTVIVAIALLGYKSYSLKKPGEAKICLGFSIIALGLQSLSSVSPNMFRLAYLYTPFMMILLPNVCVYNLKNRSILRIVLIVATVFYCLYVNRGFTYRFFWQ